jgi:hypothetical protein
MWDYQFGYFQLPRELSPGKRQYQKMAVAHYGMRELTRHGTAWQGNGMACKN